MRHPLYTLSLLSFVVLRLFAASETNAEPAKAAAPVPAPVVAPAKAAPVEAPVPTVAPAPAAAAPVSTNSPAAAPAPAAAVPAAAPAAASAADGSTMLVPKRSDDDDDEEDSSKDAEKEKLPDQRFERYKTIMDRMPFGPEPAGFDPDSGSRGAGGADAIDPNAIQEQLSEEAQRILASVRVRALNVSPSGKVAVGFTDSSQQPAVTYYMKVGESRNGWSVKDADVMAMTVTREKDGVEASLMLGEGSDGSKGGKGPSG
ncbi:MAG: hypothetical protein IJ146_12220, partial [Kiritimatiellae bacterium]|nr:hypothetical protein [Kiritimatiellia bacterium]